MPIIKVSTIRPRRQWSDNELHIDASESEERNGEHASPSEVVVTFADPGTRPVSARELVMAATEALLKYASGGQTDNDHELA